MATWGYVRISTPKQKIERQIDNIRRQYPDAAVVEETYTGTTTDRPAWNRLEPRLKAGDTVVFDEVSRMSRNAEEGMALYERLFDRGVNLVFLKEPHINTAVYRQKMQAQMERHAATGSKATDKLLDAIMEALHAYTIDIAREQIEIAFRSAQQEVDYLHRRTSEGVRKAMAAGKQVGRAAGAKVETKKAKAAKAEILKHSKSFGGQLNDEELKRLLGISYGSLYKYKRELRDAV